MPWPRMTSSVGFPCLVAPSRACLCPLLAPGSLFCLPPFCLHRSDPGAGQGGIPRGEPLGGCAVFLGPRAGKPVSSSCPHPQPLRLHSWDWGGLGMHAGRRTQGGRMCWPLMGAGTSAQPFGPCPAGAPGRKAEHAGRRGHRLLLGGLCCRGLVLPEPGVGLCPQLPVREGAACVPRGRVGVTTAGRPGTKRKISGGSGGDDVISGCFKRSSFSVGPQPHLQPLLLAHLLAGGGLLPAHDVPHQPRGCRRLPAPHGPAFCPAHCSRRAQQLGLRQPGPAFPPGPGSWQGECGAGWGREEAGWEHPCSGETSG